MGNNKVLRIQFRCDFCGCWATDKPSHYKRKVRHFCSTKCYSDYRKYIMLPEEHNIERRTVSVEITVDDIETILKTKGIAKSLGVCEIESFPTTFNISVTKFTPVPAKKTE